MIKQKVLRSYISRLKKIFKNVSEPGGGQGYRFSHGSRVMIYVRSFLKKYPEYFRRFKIDSDTAIIAALFHDIGKIKAISRNRIIDYNSRGNLDHHKIGSQIIRKILKGSSLSDEKINKISQIIQEQHGRAKKLPESILVSDCDILDNCGLLKLWRTITYAQYQKRGIERVWEYWEKEGFKKTKDELRLIRFPLIRRVAMKRLRRLNKVIKELKQEAEGKDL